MSKKIFLSPERRPAPHGGYLGSKVYEHDYCNEIGEILQLDLERNGFYATLITDSKKTMADRVRMANSGGYDYYMAIHTNAGGGTGTECLYYNHSDSIRANQLVYNELVKLYPSKRGIKDFSQFYENNSTKMVSCYPEIAFHDNANDVKFLLENKAPIAKALCKGICKYFGVTYLEETSSTDKYGVVKQVIVLTGKDKAQAYADELNAKQGSADAYFKIVKI